MIRPKTRGELLKELKNGNNCEVIGFVSEMTAIMLKGWLEFENFKVYPSDNIGWSIFEPIKNKIKGLNGKCIPGIKGKENNGHLSDTDGDVVIIKKSLPIIKFHTDGACSGNPGPGGWAFVADGNINFEGSGRVSNTTNNRMELAAMIKALEATPAHQPIIILTDSELNANCAIGKYKRKSNLDLWRRYNEALKGRTVEVIWERRDSSEGNKRANKLAQQEAQRIKESL